MRYTVAGAVVPTDTGTASAVATAAGSERAGGHLRRERADPRGVHLRRLRRRQPEHRGALHLFGRRLGGRAGPDLPRRAAGRGRDRRGGDRVPARHRGQQREHPVRLDGRPGLLGPAAAPQSRSGASRAGRHRPVRPAPTGRSGRGRRRGGHPRGRVRPHRRRSERIPGARRDPAGSRRHGGRRTRRPDRHQRHPGRPRRTRPPADHRAAEVERVRPDRMGAEPAQHVQRRFAAVRAGTAGRHHRRRSGDRQRAAGARVGGDRRRPGQAVRRGGAQRLVRAPPRRDPQSVDPDCARSL